MRFSRLSVGLLTLAAASACSDGSAPFAPFYVLVAVDGHPLPVVSNGVDFTSTLLAGTLVLDRSGRALRIDHYRDFSANDGMTNDSDQKLSGPYTIANDSISVRWTSQGQCGPGPCLPNDIGVVSDSIVTLTADFGARTSPVYGYRLLLK